MKLKLDEINPKLETVILFLDALWVTPDDNIFSAISWRGQVKFYEMIMLSALSKTNTLSWIFIILAHRTDIPQVDMSLYSDI